MRLHTDTVWGRPFCLRQARAMTSWPQRPAMSIEFRERPIREWFYQYFREPLNQLIDEFEDDDLERMKQRVAAREEWSPLTY